MGLRGLPPHFVFILVVIPRSSAAVGCVGATFDLYIYLNWIGGQPVWAKLYLIQELIDFIDRTNQMTSADIARSLGLSRRMARNLLRDWVEEGWLEMADTSRRGRAYTLSASYRQFIGNLTAMTD